MVDSMPKEMTQEPRCTILATVSIAAAVREDFSLIRSRTIFGIKINWNQKKEFPIPGSTYPWSEAMKFMTWLEMGDVPFAVWTERGVYFDHGIGGITFVPTSPNVEFVLSP